MHKSKEPVSLDNMNENEKEGNVVGSVRAIHSNERKQANNKSYPYQHSNDMDCGFRYSE
ncbi:MAG TPA: hypothetical protein VJ225_03050 [Nitrososphaeraceae archaeon]|nr:hypothetical protein [Nitrososphaeraceae archaeon]